MDLPFLSHYVIKHKLYKSLLVRDLLKKTFSEISTTNKMKCTTQKAEKVIDH